MSPVQAGVTRAVIHVLATGLTREPSGARASNPRPHQQLAPFSHGLGSQSSILISQVGPSKPVSSTGSRR